MRKQVWFHLLHQERFCHSRTRMQVFSCVQMRACSYLISASILRMRGQLWSHQSTPLYWTNVSPVRHVWSDLTYRLYIHINVHITETNGHNAVNIQTYMNTQQLAGCFFALGKIDRNFCKKLRRIQNSLKPIQLKASASSDDIKHCWFCIDLTAKDNLHILKGEGCLVYCWDSLVTDGVDLGWGASQLPNRQIWSHVRKEKHIQTPPTPHPPHTQTQLRVLRGHTTHNQGGNHHHHWLQDCIIKTIYLNKKIKKYILGEKLQSILHTHNLIQYTFWQLHWNKQKKTKLSSSYLKSDDQSTNELEKKKE